MTLAKYIKLQWFKLGEAIPADAHLIRSEKRRENYRYEHGHNALGGDDTESWVEVEYFLYAVPL